MSSKVAVIIDTREPDSVEETFYRHPDVVGTLQEELPAADIEINGVGFERKSIGDYASSLQDGRIESQCEGMRQRYEHAYILLDSSLVESDNPFGTGMSGESIRGSMAALTAREDSGVHSVIPCSNIDLLADMAVRIARKHIEESDQSYIPTSAISDDHPTAMMMYACIDGVGPSMAKKLYEKYPSMSRFVSQASVDNLQEIEGVGEKTAMTILEGMI